MRVDLIFGSLYTQIASYRLSILQNDLINGDPVAAFRIAGFPGEVALHIIMSDL